MTDVIHCLCVVVAYYLLVYLPCVVLLFAICLVDDWLIMWFNLVGYAYFVLARCNLIVPMRGDACGIGNQ